MVAHYTNIKRYYNDIFKECVCSSCRLCYLKDSDGPSNISYCMIVWSTGKSRFYEILAYLLALRFARFEEFKNILTFPGFCGVFCNSNKKCPQYSKQCESLDQKIDCFRDFSHQFKKEITSVDKAKIYELFSGIDSAKIGEKYRMLSRNSIRMVSNRRSRRRIRKMVKRAKSAMKIASHSYSSTAGFASVSDKSNGGTNNARMTKFSAKERQPKTELFCNDSAEWRAKIEEYLGRNNDEIDN